MMPCGVPIRAILRVTMREAREESGLEIRARRSGEVVSPLLEFLDHQLSKDASLTTIHTEQCARNRLRPVRQVNLLSANVSQSIALAGDLSIYGVRRQIDLTGPRDGSIINEYLLEKLLIQQRSQCTGQFFRPQLHPSSYSVLKSDKEAVVRLWFDLDYVPVHFNIDSLHARGPIFAGAVFSRQKRQSSNNSSLCIIAIPGPDSKLGAAVGLRSLRECRRRRWLRTRYTERGGGGWSLKNIRIKIP
jgi:hypothetical protein